MPPNQIGVQPHQPGMQSLGNDDFIQPSRQLVRHGHSLPYGIRARRTIQTTRVENPRCHAASRYNRGVFGDRGPVTSDNHLSVTTRWTWLILAAYTQLHLARGLADDLRRPWQQ